MKPEVTPTVEIDQARQQAQEGETRRVRNISALATQYRMDTAAGKAFVTDEQVHKWIAEGTSEADVRNKIGDMILERHKPIAGAPAEIVDMSAREKSNYSIVRAISCMAQNKREGLEFEVSEEIGKKLG